MKRLAILVMAAGVALVAGCSSQSTGSDSELATLFGHQNPFACAMYFNIGGDPTRGVIGGMNGRVFETMDGMNYSEVPSPLFDNFSDIRFVRGGLDGIGVGKNGMAAYTDNGGLNWTQVSSFTNSKIYQVAFGDATTATAVGENGYIGRTLNAGLGYNLQDSGTGFDLFSVYFNGVDRGVVGGAMGTTLRTDNGVDWESVGSLSMNHITGIFLDLDFITAVAMNGNVLQSSDFGATWNVFPSSTGIQFMALDFQQLATPQGNLAFGGSFTGNVLAAGTGGIARSNQFGNQGSWTRVLTGGEFRKVMFVDTTAYAVEQNGNVWCSEDDGDTWTVAVQLQLQF